MNYAAGGVYARFTSVTCARLVFDVFAMPAIHSFDQSLELRLIAEGRFATQTSVPYWNSFGPFGGWTAALLLKAVTADPRAVGTPVSLSINFISGLKPGAFEVRNRLVKQNRTLAFWQSEMVQANDGDPATEAVVAQAQCVLALERETFAILDARVPSVPRPDILDIASPRRGATPRPNFLDQYDYRPASGRLFAAAETMNSALWVRDAVPRALDCHSLAALADTAFPSIWLRLQAPVRITTVTMTVYFRASAAELAAAGGGYVLVDSRADAGKHGYYDQTSNLWSESGVLLAQTQQLAWFTNPAA